jgi:hypothetical protein
MLPDFAVAYSEFISEDGRMSPPIAVPVPAGVVWAVDDDGLVMTTSQFTMDGDECLLTVLFPMELGAAQSKHRQRRFPARGGDYMTVLRKRDEVVGQSGERYSRFIVEVTPAVAMAGVGPL